METDASDLPAGAYVVATVDVRGERGLVLPTKQLRDLAREAAERDAFGVHHEPFALDVSRVGLPDDVVDGWPAMTKALDAMAALEGGAGASAPTLRVPKRTTRRRTPSASST